MFRCKKSAFFGGFLGVLGVNALAAGSRRNPLPHSATVHSTMWESYNNMTSLYNRKKHGVAAVQEGQSASQGLEPEEPAVPPCHRAGPGIMDSG